MIPFSSSLCRAPRLLFLVMLGASVGMAQPRREPVASVVPAPASSAGPVLDGGALPPEVVAPAGRLLTFVVRGADAERRLVLRDEATRAVWFSGVGRDLRLSLFLLRRSEFPIAFEFEAAGAAPAETRRVVVRRDASVDAFYPGWSAEVFAGTGAIPSGPVAYWPDAMEKRLRTPYPAFRTGESVHAPNLTDPAKPRWTPPSYFRSVLPHLTLAPTREAIVGEEAFHAYPLGDLANRAPVRARLSGAVLVPGAGTVVFRLESDRPARLASGGQEAEAGAELSVPVSGPGALPLNITLAKAEGGAAPALRLCWKPPGAPGFTPVPAAALVHRVEVARERALGLVTGDFVHRRAVTEAKADDAAAVALRDALTPASAEPADTAVLAPHVATAVAFEAAVRPLADAFLRGRRLAGDPQSARVVFALVKARSAYLRAHPEQLKTGGFEKTDGRTMRLYEAISPMLFLAENHPVLQREALAARAELAQYAVATCLSRAFLSEEHYGANDGYYDDGNLLVNFWRAARCLDDPGAWDAAACLQDSHFRYAPGCEESLCSDGMHSFHNVNGRQLYPLGYGVDWVNRILKRADRGSPWDYTPEQYRRLVAFCLGSEWIFYRDTKCWCAHGRYNTHRGDPGYLTGWASAIRRNAGELLRPEDRAALEALSLRLANHPANSVTGNRFFFRNLYAVHRREDYFVDVKMTSPIVATSESFRGQVAWNMNFGDGVTTFMRDGKEFDVIHANNGPNAAFGITTGFYKNPDLTRVVSGRDTPNLWLLRALPGTTKLDDEAFRPDRYRKGAGRVAGGVSDGVLGNCGFTFDVAGARAEKFYAFTEDGLVVLNAGVTATRAKDVPAEVTLRSNINQCDRRGDIVVLAPDGRSLLIPEVGADRHLSLPLDRPYWVCHAGVGYLVLPTGAEGGPGKRGTLRLDAETRTPLSPVPGLTYTPEQRDLIVSVAKKDRSGRVFHLWIDHGPKVEGGACAYFVCMRGAGAPAAKWLVAPPVDILANSVALQAVRDTRDGALHAFFREPGAPPGKNGRPLLEVDGPACVLWHPEKRTLTVQDPLAGCTTDPQSMADSRRVTLAPGLAADVPKTLTVTFPGVGDSDDRHRGAPVTVVVPK